MDDLERIEEFSKDICKACRTRHKCKNKYPCAMAGIVAKELYQKNGYRKNKSVNKNNKVDKTGNE